MQFDSSLIAPETLTTLHDQVTNHDCISSSLFIFDEYCASSARLQCFDTVGWASGRASGLYRLNDEVLVWLSVWSEVQIVYIWSSWCHCHPKTPSSLASFKSRLVLPFWYRLTQVVLETRPLNSCSVVVLVVVLMNVNSEDLVNLCAEVGRCWVAADVVCSSVIYELISCCWGTSVAEWLACWTQAQKGLGSNRSHDAVG